LNKIALLIPCFVLCLTGCIRFGHSTGPAAENQTAEILFTEKKYDEAISVYRKVLAADPAPSAEDAANASFGLAYTRAFYDNPQRNYPQALQEFDEFLKQYPDNARSHEAQNWRSVLKIIVEARKENEHLSKSIEQLKKLDIRHEERRGGK